MLGVVPVEPRLTPVRRRGRRRGRGRLALLVAVLAGTAGALWGHGGGKQAAPGAAPRKVSHAAKPRPRPQPTHVVQRGVGALAAPVQDAAATPASPDRV